MVTKVIDALMPVKRIARGTPDRDALVVLLQSKLRSNYIRWLEVGVGDGANVEFLLGILGEGKKFKLDVIDPQINEHDLRLSFKHRFLRISFEEFSEECVYDVINCRQSAYYFYDGEQSIYKLKKLLGPSGILAITVWTESCLLYRLHAHIAGLMRLPLTEVTHHRLGELITGSGFIQVGAIVTQGDFDLRPPITPQLAVGLFDLSARRLDISEFSDATKVATVLEFLASQGTNRCRENGVAIYQFCQPDQLASS